MWLEKNHFVVWTSAYHIGLIHPYDQHFFFFPEKKGKPLEYFELYSLIIWFVFSNDNFISQVEILWRGATVGEKRPARDSTWDSTVTLKRLVNSKSLIKGRPEKKKKKKEKKVVKLDDRCKRMKRKR